MAEIRFISKHLVQPAKIHGEPRDRIELTPWDLQLLLLGPIQKGILFQNPTHMFSNNIVDHLKTTFAQTLEFFYPLAGRFGIVVNEDDDTKSFFIDCNNMGADFIHATIDNVTISDILNPIRTPTIVQSFFPMNGKLNIEGNMNPLLAVQVNELVDGIFIGCSMNHAVVDGSTFWHFLNSWSEISRGFENISKLPVFKRWFPSETKFPLRIPSSMCSYKINNSKALLEERVFHFPKEKIAMLKAKANAEMNTNSISSFQAISAHLWRSIIRCQKVEFDQEVKYTLIVGARQRLSSSIPESYFGNAVALAKVSTTARELLELSLGEIARLMNQVIVLQTSDVLVNNFKSWAKNPRLFTLDGVYKNSVATSSSPRFNVYGADFGWGKPKAVRSGLGNKSDGKITYFPGAEEGSIDIEVCSSAEKLIFLENDMDFMESVAI